MDNYLEVLEIVHDTDNHRFTMDIKGEIAWVEYYLEHGKMYLNHSEVPRHLRGRGIGKILVQKTFEKLTEEGFSAIAVCAFIKSIARRSEKWGAIVQY